MISTQQFRSGAVSLGSWWLREWRESLPKGLKAKLDADVPRMVVRPSQDEVTISILGTRGDVIYIEQSKWEDYSRSLFERCLAKAALAGCRSVVLSLAEADVLVHSLLLPTKARSRVPELIRESITRKTPLKLDEVIVGYTVRNAGTDKAEVRYLVVPCAVLERRLARLSISRAELTGIEVPTRQDLPRLGVDFAHQKKPAMPWVAQVAVGLALLCITTTLVGYGSLVWRQHARLEAIEARLATVSSQARESTVRLQPLYATINTINELDEARTAPGVVEIWEELARLLPDSTYLTEIEIKGHDVQISGFSDGSPQLIPLIETSPILSRAVLAGPMVMDLGSGKDHFSIRATLRRARFPVEETE